MNIIDTEDMIKGLPDAALQKEAQNPSGQAPQFLVVSEIKRRKDMRERYAQNQQSQGTVKDQLLGMNAPSPQPQVASMGQPQGRPMPPMGGQMPMGQPPMQQPAPPMGMYGGGVIRMAEGLTVPQTREEQLALLAELPGGLEAIDQLGDRITGITPEERELLFNRLSANGDIIQNPSPIPYGDEFLTDEQLAVNSSTITPERIQGLQFPSGVSGFEPSNTTPQGYDQARMIAEQTARLNQAQSIKDSQAQSVQPPPNETVAKLRDENRNPNQMSLDEVRKIPGYENMEMNEERTVNRTLNIFPRTPPEVSEQIKALFRNNKPVEAQELANQYKPEPQRDPYVAMQGDLIKMPEQRPVGIEQLVAAGTNGVGMSGVGADIKAGLERQAEADAPLFDREVDEDGNISMLGGLLTGRNPDNRRETSVLGDGQLNLAPSFTSMIDQSERQAPQGTYASLVEAANQQSLSEKTRKLGEIGARIAEINETQDTSNPRVQKTLAGLVKDQEKLTSSIATGSGNAQSEDAAKLNRAPASTTVTKELQDIAAKGNNNGSITQVPNADPSFSDAAEGTTVAGLNLGKTTGSSILDNQTVQGGLDDITDRTEGEESSGYKIPQSLTDLQKRGRALGQTLISGREEESKLEAQMKDLIENRTRPTLSYADLIRESEQSMATQLADIKNEKGTQALIALGAGIASGDLGKGLSDAGKAVATSNAQKRALEARQQAVRMGFRKSEVDAVYQNQIAKENDKLEGMKFSLESLRRANAATQENERIILNFDTDLQKTIATLEQSERFKRADRATQDSLNRRAALDFVTDRMSKMQLLNKSQEEQTAISNDLLAQASTALGIEIKTVSGAGSTTSTASPATTTIGGYSVTQK